MEPTGIMWNQLGPTGTRCNTAFKDNQLETEAYEDTVAAQQNTSQTPEWNRDVINQSKGNTDTIAMLAAIAYLKEYILGNYFMIQFREVYTL